MVKLQSSCSHKQGQGLSKSRPACCFNQSTCDVQVVIADVDDEESLRSMAASARVLLNCVGPFRYWGEPVVKACIGAGAHYLDICGEPGARPAHLQRSRLPWYSFYCLCTLLDG